MKKINKKQKGVAEIMGLATVSILGISMAVMMSGIGLAAVIGAPIFGIGCYDISKKRIEADKEIAREYARANGFKMIVAGNRRGI